MTENNLIKYKIVSESMVPTIGVGDEIRFSKQAHYKLFDIIVFKRNSILTCHFVWRWLSHSDSYTTRSFKNYFADEPPVHSSDILGKVKTHKINGFAQFRIIILNFFRGTL